MVKSNFTAIIASFIFGVLVTFFATDYFSSGDNRVNSKQFTTRDHQKLGHKINPKRDTNDPFDQMDEIHERMNKTMKQMMQNSGMGFGKLDNLNMGPDLLSGDLKITHREDTRFKYIDIEAIGMNKDALKINITNDVIEISGEVKKIEKSDEGGIRSSSTSISSFHQTLSIPFGVQKEKMKVETKENKIIIKFPKKIY